MKKAQTIEHHDHHLQDRRTATPKTLLLANGTTLPCPWRDLPGRQFAGRAAQAAPARIADVVQREWGTTSSSWNTARWFDTWPQRLGNQLPPDWRGP